ncbi:MAG: hypothetical protein J7521_16850 [Caulobacter sp.]|nr:hypothetical protein [Caulobacter sp.]
MASSRLPVDEAGYVSGAAMAVTLAVALVAAALTVRGTASLRAARADFGRAQVELALAGDQEKAAMALGRNERSGSVLVELEGDKLSAAVAADDLDLLRRLGAADPSRLSSWLRAADRPRSPAEIAAADSGDVWKICGPRLVSFLGRAATLGSSTPIDRPLAGQVWRLTARGQGGWTDERVVRFTGQREQPVAVIWRRFYRVNEEGGTCARAFAPTSRG